jgi:acyl-CoA hydrolase
MDEMDRYGFSSKKGADSLLDKMKRKYPEKFSSEEHIFGHIHRGDRISIDTGCGEPQYLVRALIKQQGQIGQAREYLTKALEMFERLGSLIEPDKVKEELAKLPKEC